MNDTLGPEWPALGLQSGRLTVAALYLVIVAEFVQAMASAARPELRFGYAVLHAVYATLFTLTLWRPPPGPQGWHWYLAALTATATGLLLLNPEIGTVTALFVVLAYPMAAAFSGRTLWLWVGLLALLMAVPFMAYFGALPGLARALMPITGGFALAGYVGVSREIAGAHARSQVVLAELTAAHEQLQQSAGQVEALTAWQERARLARELHNSVAQTLFSLILIARSTQRLLPQNPAEARPHLEHLQQLARQALTAMRSLITDLRLSD